MQSRIIRMRKLVDLADIELDKAAQTLAALQAECTSSEEQLSSLTGYIAELSDKMSIQKKEITAIDLQSQRGFSDKLYQAIDAQTEKVTQLKEVLEKGREAWLEKRMRKESLLALLNKLKQKHQVEQNKREQRMLDELAAQSMMANKSRISNE
ncbi:MAG: flagellar export protein FliJ [Thiomicrorhabdus sp.]|nr:flagellar export protein FliJ [Thiomicrorhabdus sp.]